MATSNARQHDNNDAAADDAPRESKALKPRKGANGTLLKKFELVLRDVFSPLATATAASSDASCLIPRYCRLPPSIRDEDQRELVRIATRYWKAQGLSPGDAAVPSSPWPFDANTSLPRCGCVRGNTQNNPRTHKSRKSRKDRGVGDVLNDDRAKRKELQLANLIQCVLTLLPDDVLRRSGHVGDDGQSKTFRIVDFAGGTGHLAVPLALLLPACEVVCVDLKKWSLDLLHRRVDGGDDVGDAGESRQRPVRQTTTALPNLSTYHGSIQTYPDAFDLGVSLHACGEASDWALRKCLQSGASYVVCSCCCGKLRTDSHNPYVWQSTGLNEKEIKYPQSMAFASLGRHDFDEIARAADYGDLGDVRTPRNACRRVAKSLVEWDRLLFSKEYMLAHADDRTGGSDLCSATVVLTRIVPWEASPKNDILLGWHDERSNPYRSVLSSMARPQEDVTCHADFQVALHHLFGTNAVHASGSLGTAEAEVFGKDCNDWTAQEEAGIAAEIDAFVLSPRTDDGDNILKFSTGMGARKRKLIHHVAEKRGLLHWGEGKKDSEKMVIVAIRKEQLE